LVGLEHYKNLHYLDAQVEINLFATDVHLELIPMTRHIFNEFKSSASLP